MKFNSVNAKRERLPIFRTPMNGWSEDEIGSAKRAAVCYRRRSLYNGSLCNGIGGACRPDSMTMPSSARRRSPLSMFQPPRNSDFAYSALDRQRREREAADLDLNPRSGVRRAMRNGNRAVSSSSSNAAAAVAQRALLRAYWSTSGRNDGMAANGSTVTRSAESDSNGSRTQETSIGSPLLPEPSSANENSVDWVTVGTADTIGRRGAMEDEMIVARHITPHRKRIWLFAVLDGHGGSTASKFVAAHWPRLLFALLDDAGSCQARKMRLAIKTSIDRCNDMLYRHLMDNVIELSVGTTLCAVLILDNRELYCVNVGDSRALAVASDGKLLGALSKDHKPARPDEKRRIEALGGHVTNYDGVPRVMGNLSVSRALGDFTSTPYITHEPDIIGPRPLRDVHAIVVCCDGVTDVLENRAIAELVGDKLEHRSAGAQSAAESVRNSAYTHYSGDNISVLVVDMNGNDRRKRK